MKKITLLIAIFCITFSFSQTVFKLDSLKFQNWESGDWKDNLKRHFYFDNGGANDTREYQFVYENNAWDSISRAFKTYDSNTNILEVLTEAYDGSQAWVDAGKSEFSYTGNNLLSIESQFIPIGPSQFLESDRKEYGYDISDNNIEEIYMVLDAMTFQLVNSERRLHSYTGTTLDEDIFQDWVGNWLNTERRLYTYNPNGLPDQINISDWNSADWSDPVERNSFFYDTNDFNTEILVEKKIGNAFVNDSRTLNTFVNNNLTQVISQDWVNNAWLNVGNLIQNYDVNSNIEEQITQTWGGIDWVNQARVLSYWSETESLSATFIDALNINIYPNPTKDILQVQLSDASRNSLDVTLFDISGRKLKTLFINKGTITFKIPIAQQASGTYLLKIKSANNVQTFRILKD